jgi:hypothetical protein
MVAGVLVGGRDVARRCRGGELQSVQDEDEGEDVSSFLSWRKGIGLVWAKVWEWTMGCSWAATARYGPGEFFSPFYFLFLIFCFYIFYLNSYLNSILFAGICNYTNSFKI